MPKKFTTDELIKNDSFINYCFNNNAEDVKKWQTYLLNYPDEIKMVKEARQFVLLMNQMLEKHSAEFSKFNTPENIENISVFISPEPKEQTASLEGIPVISRIRRMKKYFYYAAASVVLVGSAVLLKPNFLNTPPTASLKLRPTVQTTDYKAGIAQKKTIWLPDSTLVVLNAKTSLHIDKDFGSDFRIVTLIGEAFFDVTHNQKPFIVQTNTCNIKVLGTTFNVKAYPDETTSETSLLRGSIELTIRNDNNRRFLLKPDEKAIVYDKDIVINDGSIKPGSLPGKTEKIAIQNITKSVEEGVIAETAWTQNRIEIVNEKFLRIQPALERWYDVTIHFNDEKVKDYQFTATFEDETIEQVLTALKLSYPFKYSIKGRDVFISK